MSDGFVDGSAAIKRDYVDAAEDVLGHANITLTNPAPYNAVMVVVFISDKNARGKKVSPILRRSFDRLPSHTATHAKNRTATTAQAIKPL